MQRQISPKYLLIIISIAFVSWYFDFFKDPVESVQEITASSKIDMKNSSSNILDKNKLSGNSAKNALAERHTGKKINLSSITSRIPTKLLTAKELKQHQIIQLDPNWRWAMNLSATPKSLYKGSLRDSFGEANNHILYENRVNASSANEFFIENPLVLYSPSRQKYALLTGIFIVTAQSSEDVEKILEDRNFEVVNSFADLRLIFLKPLQSPFNFNEYAQALRNDRRVSHVEYEMLTLNWVKN